jgi:3-oxoacyl-[acyl-carrier-protein] synthase-3
MPFQNVSIAGLAHVDAPHTLTSKEINERLQPTLDRLGIRADMLGDVAGIHARRLWDPGTQASDAATMAGRKALEDAGVSPDRIGLLVNTSVSRDYRPPPPSSRATWASARTASPSTSPTPAWPSSTAWTWPRA